MSQTDSFYQQNMQDSLSSKKSQDISDFNQSIHLSIYNLNTTNDTNIETLKYRDLSLNSQFDENHRTCPVLPSYSKLSWEVVLTQSSQNKEYNYSNESIELKSLQISNTKSTTYTDNLITNANKLCDKKSFNIISNSNRQENFEEEKFKPKTKNSFFKIIFEFFKTVLPFNKTNESQNSNSIINSSSKSTIQNQLQHIKNEDKKCKTTGTFNKVKDSISGVFYGWNQFNKNESIIGYHFRELLLGLMIAFTMIPQMVSYSILANVHPSLGLQGGYLLSIVVSALGGSVIIIHGPTGSMSSIIAQYISRKCFDNINGVRECTYTNLENLFVATFISGIIILIFSLFHLSTLINLIPSTVIIAFCNGLAIIIGFAQIHPFFDDVTNELYSGSTLYWSLAHMVLALIIMIIWRKIPKIGMLFPAPLVAIIVSIFFEKVVIELIFIELFNNEATFVETIEDTVRISSDQVFISPVFLNDNYSFSNITFDENLLFLTILITLCAMIETLMVADVIRSLTNFKVNGDQELFSVSIGLLLSSFFGTLPGSSMLALSIMNFKSKGRGKESGVLSGVFILLILFAGTSLLNLISLACLSGIMLFVVYNTFKWFSIPIILSSFIPKIIRKNYPKLGRKISRWDAFTILLVSILCYVLNVVIAIVIGIIITSFFFIWELQKDFYINEYTLYKNGKEIKYYKIKSPLFFCIKEKFERKFKPEEDPNIIIVELENSSSFYDFSILNTLIIIKEKYKKQDKTFIIKGSDYKTINSFEKAEYLINAIDCKVFKTGNDNNL